MSLAPLTSFYQHLVFFFFFFVLNWIPYWFRLPNKTQYIILSFSKEKNNTLLLCWFVLVFSSYVNLIDCKAEMHQIWSIQNQSIKCLDFMIIPSTNFRNQLGFVLLTKELNLLGKRSNMVMKWIILHDIMLLLTNKLLT